MREIKFKYYFTLDDKVINTKTFIMDDIEDINFNTILFLNIDINKYNFEKMKLYRSQFTGLKDINGVEIYEGDYMIDRHSGRWAEVKFINGSFIVEFDNEIQDLYDWTCECVIGNIYENKDLV